MRTTCVLALVVSLVVMTGCCSISGPDCGGGCGGGMGGQFNGSCASGGCDSGGGLFSGFGGGGGGCDSGGCATGNCGGTSQTFSDLDCGPMCGAHLNSSQFSGGGSCDSCEVGQSFAKRNWNSFGKGMPRPCFSRPNLALPNPFAGMAGKMACMKAGFGAGMGAGGGFGSAAPMESYGPTEPYVDPCNNYGCGGLAGTCKGLGGAVGCGGCGECGGGGGAVGTSHSDYSNGTPGLAGRVAGRVGGLRHRAGCGCLACKSGGGNRSHHPYGGELPHTGAADEATTGSGAAAPTYAYPYYTTRGPRDFLQDGCGPPPVYPYSPRVSCLPSIGR